MNTERLAFVVSSKDKFSTVRTFVLYYLRGYIGDFNPQSHTFQGVIIRNGVKYSIFFDNPIIGEKLNNVENFDSIEDIIDAFESNTTLDTIKYYIENYVDSTVVRNKPATSDFIKICKVIKGELNALDSFKTPNIIFNNDEFIISVNTSKKTEISLFEKSPMRLLDLVIYWKGIGAILFKVNLNHLNGEVVLVPIALYRCYDQSVKYWNDLRVGFMVRPMSPYNDAIWRQLFKDANRQEQLNLMIKFSSLKEMYDKIVTKDFLDNIRGYFVKVAKMMKTINLYTTKIPLDYLATMLSDSNEEQEG